VATKKGQSRKTGNIDYTRRRKTKYKYNTICVGHHYSQASANNVKQTCAFLRTTGGKDELDIVGCHFVLFIWSLCCGFTTSNWLFGIFKLSSIYYTLVYVSCYPGYIACLEGQVDNIYGTDLF
jgi:hypothetical protein